jgi:TRAP transporter TAXI family solute receptor
MKPLRIAAMAAAAALIAGAANAQTVTIATSAVGSLNYSVGNALGKVLAERGVKARVTPFGGHNQTLPLMNKGQVDFAIADATDALFAYQGVENYKDLKSDKVRVAGSVFPFYIGWFVKKDAPYKSLAELKGKKVAIGYTASPQQRVAAIASMYAFGVKEADFDGVPVANVVRGAEDFMQGKVEATSFAAGAGKVAEVDSKVGGIRYLSIPQTDDATKAIRALMPTAYIGTLQPAPAYAGIVGPTNLLFENYMVVVGAHVADAIVADVAKVLYENKAELAAIAKPFANYEPNELSTDRGVPFHPGAIAFYQKVGIWPKK